MRPIGVWAATAYLLLLLVLGVIYLSAAIEGGSVHFILPRATEVLTVLLSAILLPSLSRLAVLPIALLAVLQTTSYLDYLNANSSTFVELRGSDTVVYVVSISYSFASLVLLTMTFVVLLYAIWLWRRGVLT